MTVYRSSKGEHIDMTALVEKNAKLRAAGNMPVNAKGDEIRSDGSIVRPVRNRVQANNAMIAKDVRTVGLKSNDDSESIFQETKVKKEEKVKTNSKKKGKEIEHEDGSITLEDDNDEA
jgi:hypothetical protein